MPKIAYRNHRFSKGSLSLIDLCINIIDEYEEQGFSLTLRQLYYQLVARGEIPNKDSEYKRLGSIVNNARMAGLIDWESIEDRTRFIRENQHWSSPLAIVDAAVRSYRIDLWQEQRCRPEVWIEKDALVGVLMPTCRKLDVPLFSCRGYPSSSSVWRAVDERMGIHLDNDQEPVVIHLGDHDPSGIDMTRDIETRVSLFAECEVWVDRIALNRDQIDFYHPPPNPAKLSDSRCAGYIKIHGKQSWELDALEPSVLANLVETTVSGLMDAQLIGKYVRKQEEERKVLRQAANAIKDDLL